MAFHHRLLTFILACTLAQTAFGLVRIDINRGYAEPLPIALPYGEKSSQLHKDILLVVEKDLESSGLFRSANRKAFLSTPEDSQSLPNFDNWRVINISALVTSDSHVSGNKANTSFRLWDVFSTKQIAGKTFSTYKENWRRSAHMIADEIYHNLTGENGYFDSRIVYISETGPATKRIKRLAIMDQDGANHRYLTDGHDLVLTPRFSPKAQKIIYMSYKNKLPRVYMMNVDSTKKELIGQFDGMSFAPRFAPDGKSVIMSVSLDGNSEIYSYDLHSKTKRRLTRDNAIDTSPSYSPDGKQIVFNSDRGGSQQLYVMDKNGKNVKRISYGGRGRYGSPVWSPRGDYIAFTKMLGGKFYIGVMHPDGSGERLLTESYLDEGPTWSPNGRVIIFARQEKPRGHKAGAWNLYSIDLTGQNERRIPTPKDASDPAWSALLP